MSENVATPQSQQQQHRPPSPIVQGQPTTKLITNVEDSSIPDVDITAVMEELNKPRELDNTEIKRACMKELNAPNLSSIEDPDTFYNSIKAYMDEKIDKGDNSLTTTKMINNLNKFIDSRMNKILMTCFRHYNSEKILEEQKALMTPPELEMANQIINSIKSFREFIYH